MCDTVLQALRKLQPTSSRAFACDRLLQIINAFNLEMCIPLRVFLCRSRADTRAVRFANSSCAFQISRPTGESTSELGSTFA